MLKKKTQKIKKQIIRLALTDELSNQYRSIRAIAQEEGLVFDPKPELLRALDRTIKEAFKELEPKKENVKDIKNVDTRQKI